jgi:hypothetical protein
MKYLFAYGSLVNDNSRNKTIEFIYPDVSYYAEISPLLGYIRVFNVRIIKNGIPQIMLGIEKSSNPSPINGILFKVSDSILKKIDDREKLYDRMIVEHQFIKTNIQLNKNDVVYIYNPKKISEISDKFPLMETYIDMCVEGFSKYGEKAVDDFLENTYF